jgi:hypothetical protein
MYTLYLKQHNVTGLQYLGVTKRNAHTYKGSGIYWRDHLVVHGNNVKTIVIIQTSSRNELSAVGRFLSKLWSVAKSENFANLKEEAGYTEFNPTPSDKRVKQARINIAKAHALQIGKKMTLDQLVLHRQKIKNSWNKRRKEGTANWIHSDQSKLHHSKGALARWKSPEQRKLQSERLKAAWVLRKARGH